MPHGSLWNSGVPCWSKNQPRPAVTPIRLSQTRILILTLARTPPRRNPNLLLTLGDADEHRLLPVEGGIPRSHLRVVVCETTPVDPHRVVVHGTTHLLRHPHAVVLVMTPARPLLVAVDATRLVRRLRRLLHVTETDEAILDAIPLPTGEATARPHLARGMWMGGTVGMTGGAGTITERGSGMSDRPGVTGGGGCLMRREESMVAGDDLLAGCGTLRCLMLRFFSTPSILTLFYKCTLSGSIKDTVAMGGRRFKSLGPCDDLKLQASWLGCESDYLRMPAQCNGFL